MPQTDQRFEQALKKAAKAKTVQHSLQSINRDMEERVVKRKADNSRMPYFNLHQFPLNPEMVSLIPKEAAATAKAIIFSEQKRKLKIGTTDPTTKELASLLRAMHDQEYTSELYLISESSLEDGLAAYQRARVAAPREKKIRIELTKEELSSFRKDIQNLQELETKIKTMPMTKVLDVIVAGAVQSDASDIHVEPEDKQTKLRYRIDGVLQDVAYLPKEAHQPIVSRIKLLSELKINVTAVPQDGRFTVTIGDRKLDVRTSILPSGYGETIVLRLLGIGAMSLNINDLGFAPRDYEKIKTEIDKPHGMILTTGPTGSGKTTSLYAFLNHVKTPEIKIITLENPIEYRLQGISQTQVEKDKGYDFATGLKSILRQDPDVVMVGEIRDLETAETALNAALTGHLVFSTLHTNDASGVIPRLIDMGVRPFIIAPAINAVIAQRLVRKLCPNCREEFKPDEKIMKQIHRMFDLPGSTVTLPTVDKLFRPHREGCDTCHGTGYKGRIGIYELFKIDREMEKLVMSAATTAEIFEEAVKTGMTTMAQDGVYKALEGITDIDEVDRVT